MVHSSCLNPKDSIVMGCLLFTRKTDWLIAVVNGTRQISGDGDALVPFQRPFPRKIGPKAFQGRRTGTS